MIWGTSKVSPSFLSLGRKGKGARRWADQAFLPLLLSLQDFGISGFRFGVLYTHNKEVASAVSSFGYLHGTSGIAQHKLYRLLQDRGTKSHPGRGSWLDLMAMGNSWFCLGF